MERSKIACRRLRLISLKQGINVICNLANYVDMLRCVI
jgi:hypothetical protein